MVCILVYENEGMESQTRSFSGKYGHQTFVVRIPAQKYQHQALELVPVSDSKSGAFGCAVYGMARV